MKPHAHKELIEKWLNDTTIQFETYWMTDEEWHDVSHRSIFLDTDGIVMFRVKEADPYAELRKAEKAGKRIVWQDSAGCWRDRESYKTGWRFDYAPGRYKVVNDDCISRIRIYDPGIGQVSLEIKKCGITGNITSRVIS